MACACKVTQHISKVEERYGTKVLPTKKTDISGMVKLVLKNILLMLLMLPFIPIIILYVLIRNCFTKKAISIDKFLKMKRKHVRN